MNEMTVDLLWRKMLVVHCKECPNQTALAVTQGAFTVTHDHSILARVYQPKETINNS